MPRIRLLLAYDGTDFWGWQKQPNAGPTVQGVLEACLAQIYQKPIAVVGSGRTDRGVHALNQVAHFDLPEGARTERLAYQLRRLTPESLTIKKLWLAPPDFHAQISVVRKTYLYRMQVGSLWNPFRARYSWFPRPRPSLEYLQEASSLLLGEHDFSSFQSKGTIVSSPVRRLEVCRWVAQKPDLWTFEIVGNGFLKQMVRNIVGTLVRLEREGRPPQDLLRILEGRDRRLAAPPAPPQGLFLKRVTYPQDLDNKCRKL